MHDSDGRASDSRLKPLLQNSLGREHGYFLRRQAQQLSVNRFVESAHLGAGRSTRFLQNLGFTMTGVAISAEMVRLALERDSRSDYLLTRPGEPIGLEPAPMDLVLAAFPFDNIPTAGVKTSILRDLRFLLRTAVSGDVVRIVMLDVADSRPIEDIVWTHEDYLAVYREAGLAAEAVYRPLGRGDEE